MSVSVISLRPNISLHDTVGIIPHFLNEQDPRPAKEQFDTAYVSGWQPFHGFRRDDLTLTYPGDPPMKPLALITFKNERIFVYQHAWVMILEKDGTFEVARMD